MAIEQPHTTGSISRQLATFVAQCAIRAITEETEQRPSLCLAMQPHGSPAREGASEPRALHSRPSPHPSERHAVGHSATANPVKPASATTHPARSRIERIAKPLALDEQASPPRVVVRWKHVSRRVAARRRGTRITDPGRRQCIRAGIQPKHQSSSDRLRIPRPPCPLPPNLRGRGYEPLTRQPAAAPQAGPAIPPPGSARARAPRHTPLDAPAPSMPPCPTAATTRPDSRHEAGRPTPD